MTDIIWTDERIERLRGLFAEKFSASEIAATLGEGLTRNAICGKLARLGLVRGISVRVPPGKKPRVPKHEAKGAPTGSLAYKVIHAIKRKQAAPVDPTPFVCRAVENADPLNLSLDQLTETTCRYPSAEAPFSFCGQLNQDGSPYCTPHHRICYIGVPQRKATVVNPAEFGKSRGGVFGRVA